MQAMTYSGTSWIVMTINARFTVAKDRMAKIMEEDMETLQKENSELRQKVVIVNDDSHHAYNE